MRITKEQDGIIRSVKTFKKYNDVLSDIVSEEPNYVNGRGLEKPLFCGVFTAKIYIGQQIIGTYKFDCSHFRNWRELNTFVPRLTKVK